MFKKSIGFLLVLMLAVSCVFSAALCCEAEEDTDRVRVGAMRWDAYFATKSPSNFSVADQVARTLSNYPWQAPYYAVPRNVEGSDVTMSFPSMYAVNKTVYTLDNVKKNNLAPMDLKYEYGVTWEEEATLAMDAGIDFFAYIVYGDGSGMSLPRMAHVATNGKLPDGRQMGLAFILEPEKVGETVDLDKFDTDDKKFRAIPVERRQIYQGMAMSCYETMPDTDRRLPIFYLYSVDKYSAETIAMIRKEAVWCTAYYEKINAEKYTHIDDVYFAGMCYADGAGAVSAAKASELALKGLSAQTRYGVGMGGAAGETVTITRYEYDDLKRANPREITATEAPFAELSRRDKEVNEAYANVKAIIKAIPEATLGQHWAPRFDIGVKWISDEGYGSRFVALGTAEQQAQNVRQALEFAYRNPDTDPARSIVIYAWNEHDEGGYLCPSVKCDADGKPIIENGKFVKDTAVIDAVAAAIKEVHANKGVTPAPAENDPTNAPEEPAKKGCGSVLLPALAVLVIPAAIVVRKKEN